jgi:hypothetical protein
MAEGDEKSFEVVTTMRDNFQIAKILQVYEKKVMEDSCKQPIMKAPVKRVTSCLFPSCLYRLQAPEKSG